MIDTNAIFENNIKAAQEKVKLTQPTLEETKDDVGSPVQKDVRYEPKSASDNLILVVDDISASFKEALSKMREVMSTQSWNTLLKDASSSLDNASGGINRLREELRRFNVLG
jgi:division protein CdvB (Snf7/Vps24/ESCRT-III family)